MGDRSNVFIQTKKVGDEWQGVGIYSHWGGREFQDAAIDCVASAEDRIGDVSYFTRIVIHNLLERTADVNRTTGHGVWIDHPDDNEYPILVINAMTGEHWRCEEANYRKDKQ